MGLAASQARLLLLTARKSDLEYRAQMICQRKTMLAMQTEELATNYSRALNDRKLYFTYYAEANKGVAKEELLTYEGFTSTQNTTRYRLIDAATGQVVALNEKDAEKYKNSRAGTVTRTTDANGQEVTTPTNSESLDDKDFNYKWANILKSPEGLQNAIQSGALLIQQMNVTAQDEVDDDGNKIGTSTVTTWKYVALSGMDDVRSKLYTDNDAAASAEYEYQSLLIQNQDKQLDVELKQVETQQKACETEIDSVKKVMDKNIEHSFKTFG